MAGIKGILFDSHKVTFKKQSPQKLLANLVLNLRWIISKAIVTTLSAEIKMVHKLMYSSIMTLAGIEV